MLPAAATFHAVPTADDLFAIDMRTGICERGASPRRDAQ